MTLPDRVPVSPLRPSSYGVFGQHLSMLLASLLLLIATFGSALEGAPALLAQATPGPPALNVAQLQRGAGTQSRLASRVSSERHVSIYISSRSTDQYQWDYPLTALELVPEPVSFHALSPGWLSIELFAPWPKPNFLRPFTRAPPSSA